MPSRKNKVTLILPFHSDVDRLKNTLPAIERFLNSNPEPLGEIILSQNGHPPNNLQLELSPPFRLLQTAKNGIGEGYAQGIQAAQCEWVLLSASDLPFGFSDLNAIQSDGFSADLYIGSKLHPLSSLAGYGFLRISCSYLFYCWRLFFFGRLTPRDSQGTILVRADIARSLLQETKSRDFFFAVEFIFRAQSRGLIVKEVPVKFENLGKDSSVSIFRDGFLLFMKAVWLRISPLSNIK